METNLSLQEFKKYFKSNKLGKLDFPNGECVNEYGNEIPFHIDLRNLYRLVTGWKINSTEVPLKDIIGIIAFGSAVKYPGYEKASRKRKKYFLFGPEVTKTKQFPIQPDDADFFVITGKNITREKVIEPVSIETYDCFCLKEGGIHLVNRGIEQVVKGIEANDTVSSSAMREGVPIFYDKRLINFQKRISSRIRRETPRRIFWDEDDDGCLIGKIE